MQVNIKDPTWQEGEQQMYLHQKLGFIVSKISTHEDLLNMLMQFNEEDVKFAGYDTETTGLEIIRSVPFLFVFGFNKHLYSLDLIENPKFAQQALKVIYNLSASVPRLFAHNAQYDLNMMENYGAPIPEDVMLGDSSIVFRLTTYVDDLKARSLTAIGKDLIDDSADFAEKVIKQRINRINAERKKVAESHFRKVYAKELKAERGLFSRVWKEYQSGQIQFIKHEYQTYFDELDTVYTEANYLSVYEENPEIMTAYAYDDVAIMLEYLSVSLPVLMEVDANLSTFNRECDMLRVSQRQERTGIKVDIDYMIESRENLIKYREELYSKFHQAIGEKVSSGQHKRIRELFARNWGMFLGKADKATFEQFSGAHPQAQVAADLIVELRTVEKWLSTYIEGMLNRVINGRVYVNIDNTGTKTGRASSGFQQQPKDALRNTEGVELFHPRRPFGPDEGYTMYSMDYSQHELRVQAYWTLLVSKGDKNLCRAYMPYDCHHKPSGQQFDYKNVNMLALFDTEEWIENDTGNIWHPLDLHSVTTMNAFPGLDPESPDFESKRHLGKMANFLKNYGGGKNALMDSLKIGDATATLLDNAYYKSYPEIKTYQRWADKQVSKYGYVENLYGRRYYLRNTRFAYKVYNYLIQGSCADMLKEVQIAIDKALKGYESYIAMPIHDEVIIMVKDGEESVVDIVLEVMMKQPEQIPYVPMKVGTEWTKDNWRDMVSE